MLWSAAAMNIMHHLQAFSVKTLILAFSLILITSCKDASEGRTRVGWTAALRGIALGVTQFYHYNRVLPAWAADHTSANASVSPQAPVHGYPTFRVKFGENEDTIPTLTTPVAYLKDYYLFGTKDEKYTCIYYSHKEWWMLIVPYLDRDVDIPVFDVISDDGFRAENITKNTYDPSNGVKSSGDLVFCGYKDEHVRF